MRWCRRGDKADHIEWDDDLPGFGVRMRGDSKKWDCQYRVNGKQRRESLGDVRKVALEDARKIARQRFAQVELGVDPAAERARGAPALTLGVVVGRYLDAKRDRLRPNTFKAAKRYLTGAWKPLHDRPLEGDQDGAPTWRRGCRSSSRRTGGRRRRGRATTCRRCIGWAMKEGLCEANPVMATNDPTEGMPARDRVLTDGEVRAVWNACQDDDFRRASSSCCC